ncbi:MAG: hypothetical protein PHC28_05900 [Flavobacterium sp.]|uniref:hypothetical protein n=1 Tax=Flavobacterium sp. TaxID=239 RepID=UPI00261A07D0|nr:hypothetical protein [Flavobacterium sp.]MDD5150002.1 hypothetical protein [Flavobacterium sp.]
MRYKILVGDNSTEMNDLVTNHLNDSWELFNGLQIINDCDGRICKFIQVVVQQDNIKKEVKQDREYLFEHIAPIYHPDIQKMNSLREDIRCH